MPEAITRGGVHRGVVTQFDVNTCWGHLVYAVSEHGNNVVDAISAALIAKAQSTAYRLRIQCTGREVVSLKFHSTSFHNSYRQEWPQLGQLVTVHLNDDQRLVAVWHDGRRE